MESFVGYSSSSLAYWTCRPWFEASSNNTNLSPTLLRVEGRFLERKGIENAQSSLWMKGQARRERTNGPCLGVGQNREIGSSGIWRGGRDMHMHECGAFSTEMGNLKSGETAIPWSQEIDQLDERGMRRRIGNDDDNCVGNDEVVDVVWHGGVEEEAVSGNT